MEVRMEVGMAAAQQMRHTSWRLRRPARPLWWSEAPDSGWLPPRDACPDSPKSFPESNPRPPRPGRPSRGPPASLDRTTPPAAPSRPSRPPRAAPYGPGPLRALGGRRCGPCGFTVSTTFAAGRPSPKSGGRHSPWGRAPDEPRDAGQRFGATPSSRRTRNTSTRFSKLQGSHHQSGSEAAGHCVTPFI
ncbi:unnamed protein product [Lampetra fluviatilis]